MTGQCRCEGDGRVDLLGTTEFGELLRRASRAPLLRHEVLPDDLPEGYGLDEVWEVLTSLRMAEAFYSPSISYDNGSILRYWHTVPLSLQESLYEIARLTQEGSPLDVIVRDHEDSRFITQQYIEEMLANLRLDGYPAEYEEIRSVLTEALPPQSPAEKLAANFHRILCSFGDYAGAPLTAELMRQLYGVLVENVDVKGSEHPSSEPQSPLGELYHREVENSLRPDFLDIVASIAAGYSNEEGQHPIVISLLVNCQFWRAPVFPVANNLMGCIASRYYLYGKGYPVFRFIPKIRILENWKRGLYGDIATCSFDESAVHYADSVDWTAYYDTVMKLMLHEVRTMQRSLTRLRTADSNAMDGIKCVPYLSYRQVEVLRRAVLVPDEEFRIVSHQASFGVAYATARADLEGLTDLGLLVRRKVGQSFIYSAAPNLRSRLESYAQ